VTHAQLVAHVVSALAAPLPGATAHDRAAPRPRREWPAGFDHEHIRHAAGLLLLFPIDDRTHVVLTVRADSLQRHGGQVSLPGGVLEPGESVEQAALREAREEIGLETSGVQTLGILTPVDIPVSGFRLHPVVAAIDRRPAFTPHTAEVARIVEIPVEALLDASCFAWKSFVREGRTIEAPAFAAAGVEVWGATAMAVAEFLSLLGWNAKNGVG
jgi:8-oxo-dGTP pyrophosphatase MutT (NUDIX family)